MQKSIKNVVKIAIIFPRNANEDTSAQLTIPEQAQHQSFIPGMSAYDSQDANNEAGTAQCTSNFSLSTKAAHCEEYAIFSQTSDVESDVGSFFG